MRGQAGASAWFFTFSLMTSPITRTEIPISRAIAENSPFPDPGIPTTASTFIKYLSITPCPYSDRSAQPVCYPFQIIQIKRPYPHIYSLLQDKIYVWSDITRYCHYLFAISGKQRYYHFKTGEFQALMIFCTKCE